MTFKKQLYFIFQHPTRHKYGVYLQVLIFLNIITSIVIMFLETEPKLKQYADIFNAINIGNILIFTVEYILRLYSININKQIKRFRYAFTPLMLIDLIVILPFYLSLFHIDMGFLRGLRIIRIFKIFRIAKFAHFENLIGEIITEKKEEFIYIFVVLFIFVLTLTPLVYYLERDVQPEVFSSMIETMWWSVITFTTVGYGDMYLVTPMGKVVTSIVSFLGIAFYAIPGSIFTSALLEKINEKKRKRRKIKSRL